MVEVFIELLWSLFFEIALRLPGELVLLAMGTKSGQRSEAAVTLFSLIFWGIAAGVGVAVWVIAT